MVNTSSKDLAERTRLTNRSDQIRKADRHSRWMPPSKDSARRSETELASTLWSRLPIARIADETGFRTIEQVIRAASSSHSAIVGWHAEFRQFVGAICDAAIELRGHEDCSPDLRDNIVDEIRERTVAEVKLPMPNRSFIDYRFGNLAPADALKKAVLQIERFCVEFANSIRTTFEQLQGLHLVGSIENTETTCRFTFFRRVAVFNRGQAGTQERSRLDPLTIKDKYRAYFFETYEVADTTIQHRNSMHAHHVRNSALRDVDATKYPLPKKYRKLVDSCPDWLRPTLRVIEGDLFREERIEWDTRVERRPDEVLVSSRWHRCPAIVYGEFVLAGWGEEAISAEEKRVESEQDEANLRRAASISTRYQNWASLTAILAVLAMLLSVKAPTVFVTIAVLLGVISMWLAAKTAEGALLVRNACTEWRVVLYSLSIGLTTFGAQASIFAVLHRSWRAAGLAAVFACAAWLAHVAKRQDERQVGSRVE